MVTGDLGAGHFSFNSKKELVSKKLSERAPTKFARLVWNMRGEAGQIVAQAHSDALSLASDLDLVVVCHEAYGKGFMKKCSVSPDAYVQMAMQLAYFRDQNRFSLTYESSMTRLFLDGRTETVRPLTDESAAFVRCMEAKDSSNDEKLQALQAAAARHQTAYMDAMAGKGIDRHLFGLYCVSVGKEVDSDFLKTAMKEPWRLSTSQQPQQQTDRWDLR